MNVLDAAINNQLTGTMVIKDSQSNLNKNTQVNSNSDKKNVKLASTVGATLGIGAAVAGIYSMAKKGNPTVTLKNITYDEKDVLIIAAGSVIGGLSGGLLADKNPENKVPKLRESLQQFGNTLFPVGILAVNNKILEKTGFKLPQIKSSSKYAKTINGLLAVLPKVVVTIGSLVGGMELGNKIINKVNNKIFKEDVKHDVHAEDYLVHTDDICLAANMIFKDIKCISALTSKLLPLTFLVSGAKTGIQEFKDKD